MCCTDAASNLCFGEAASGARNAVRQSSLPFDLDGTSIFPIILHIRKDRTGGWAEGEGGGGGGEGVREGERQTDRQTDIETDRQTDRQRDRQTDRQRQRRKKKKKTMKE